MTERARSAAKPRRREHRHPMQVVTRRTGLSPDLLRVWEKRYAVVQPTRSESGRRLYTDADIDRLELLRRATLAGRTIGQVATLSRAELEEILRQDAEAERAPSPGIAGVASAIAPRSLASAELLRDCMRAVERLDAFHLDSVLRRAVVALSADEFLAALVAPLLDLIGRRWQEGTLRPVHGHLASTIVRRALERVIEAASSPLASPHLLVATPAGQTHEFGALLSAAAAAAEGWRVTYLGSSLPAEDIAEAAARTGARAIALSLVYPPDDRTLEHEVRRLASLLGDGVSVVAGGRAVGAYRRALDAAGATVLEDVTALRTALREMAGAGEE